MKMFCFLCDKKSFQSNLSHHLIKKKKKNTREENNICLLTFKKQLTSCGQAHGH